ncbi:MAG: CPBP family intramembrane metalloprotease [Eubacteriales bacterium]|nr:CPBP family intramembrane metalloprotease [Eubacteriales bacterium]
MKELYRKIVRSSGKLTDILPIAGVLSVLLVLVGAMLSIGFQHSALHKSIIALFTDDEAVGLFLTEYGSFAGIWVLALVILLIFPYNWPMLRAFGYNRRGNNLKFLLIGLLVGFGANGFCVLMSWIMGDIKLSFNGFDLRIILGFIIMIFIQSGGEEITDRLYLYQKLRRRYRSPWVAIIVNSAVFAGMHVGNPGFTAVAGVQLVLAGLAFSMFIYCYDSLWGAMSFHMAWNFTQNILFGLPNSGIVTRYSIFKLEAASARSGLFYNVNFGVEGSIGACLVLAVVIVFMLLRNRGKGERFDYWAEMEKKLDAKREEKDRLAERNTTAA